MVDLSEEDKRRFLARGKTAEEILRETEEKPEATQTGIEKMKEKEVLETKMKGFRKRTFLCVGGAIGCTVAYILALAVDHYKNPHRNNPIVLEYHSAITSLEDLRKERRSMKIPDISYQPENVKPHLERAFEKATSLDKAIEGIESNIGEMEHTKSVNKYKNWCHEPANSIALVGIYGFMASIVFGLYNMFRFDLTERKFLRKGFRKYPWLPQYSILK